MRSPVRGCVPRQERCEFRAGWWFCEYSTRCKVVLLPKEDPTHPTIDRSPQLGTPRQGTEFEKIFGKGAILDVGAEKEDTYSDFNESDFSEVSDSRWSVESTSESEPECGYESEEDLKLTNAYRIKEDDRKDLSSLISRYIDTERYYVCASSKENHVHILWKKRKKQKKLHRYAEALDSISQIRGAREFSSSRTCRVNRGGIKLCYDKIRLWQKWHSILADFAYNANSSSLRA